jgi:putative endonuclease
MREHGGWVYILASRRNGTLYTGVTNDLLARVFAHKEGVGSKFTRKYGVTWLVWYEAHSRIENAIQRETSIKRWPRKWKLDLIEKSNPEWRDLYEEFAATPTLPDWAK